MRAASAPRARVAASATSARRRDAAVLGAGVVGLHAALALAQSGAFARVRVVAERACEGTTSAVSAAFWYPFIVRTEPVERADAWALTSLAWYEETAGRADAAASGVETRRFKEFYAERRERPGWASAVRYHRALERGEFDETRYAGGFEFDAPVAAMPKHLPWLLGECERAGVTFELGRKVERLEDVVREEDEVVVNCAGLGARELVEDADLVPVRGQILYIEQDIGEGIFDDDPTKLAYLIPRKDVTVLGGTAVVGDERLTIDEGDSADIFKKCQALYPQLDASKIVGANVGLRPYRKVVRCELDASLLDGARLIHCYGHGGAGMTLARGSALDVVRLALESR